MLRVEDINVYYGAIHAIKGISLEVNDGEIVALIGSNGAGKSTTLRTISGLKKPKTGRKYSAKSHVQMVLGSLRSKNTMVIASKIHMIFLVFLIVISFMLL